jgi:hypothetical protein
VVPELTEAFEVERACTSGAMTFASGPDDAPELVTAWQTPPDTPSQEPSLYEPRGSGDTDGSVAVAALDTRPVQASCPSQDRAAPAAEAADGPAGNRAVFTCDRPATPRASTAGAAVSRLAGPPACGCWLWDWPLRASAAPEPVDAFDTDCTSQPAVPAVQLAVPVDVRGLPPATAPSHALELVWTVPEHSTPEGQTRLALDEDVDVGPLVG